MEKLKVAYQGAKGAYSYIAALEYFSEGAELQACESFHSAFDKVLSRDVNYAMIPIENSTAGRVSDVHLLLKNKNLHIVGEFFLPIKHCLIGFKGTALEEIKSVYSHPQALMQCENNIHKYGYKRVPSIDTAISVKEIIKLNDKKNAAIASSLAAKQHNLEVLINGFQDFKTNITRFVIIGYKAEVPIYDESTKYITTFIFDIKDDDFTLSDCLRIASEQKINLLKLESYSKPGQFKLASFYMDVEGHINSKSLDNMINIVKSHMNEFKLIGCYESENMR